MANQLTDNQIFEYIPSLTTMTVDFAGFPNEGSSISETIPKLPGIVINSRSMRVP